MKNIRSAFFFCCLARLLATYASAAQANTPINLSAASQTNSVINQLQQRSQLPAIELQRLLADCAATQQSMFFCAWRDQISAQQRWEKAVRQKQIAYPDCKPSIAVKAEKYSQLNDQNCEHEAAQDWAGGCMKPTTKALCMARAITHLTQRLKQSRGCKMR